MGSGALNILWAQAVNDADGTFKPADQLEQLYESKGITPDREIIAYCRIGEIIAYLVCPQVSAWLSKCKEL
jgi:thiosulfate/3-mercaptopyruvate sulfurtransferase